MIEYFNLTLTGAITPNQSGHKSNVTEEVLHIRQISRTVASPSGFLLSYQDTTLGDSYPSAESAYSTALANWVCKISAR